MKRCKYANRQTVKMKCGNALRSRCHFLISALFICTLTYLHIAVFAASVPIQPLPEIAALDTERSRDYALAPFNPYTRDISITLWHRGASTNAFEIAFGVDADFDGTLSLAEREFSFGWNAGRLFAKSSVTGLDHSEAIALSLEPMKLTWALSIRNGAVISLAATNGTASVFADLSEADLRQFWSPAWNMMRVTVNGDALSTTDGELLQRSDGLTMFLR